MKAVKIDKVNLMEFIETLKSIYDSGVEYVDIVGYRNTLQDVMSVEVRDEYMRNMELTDELMDELIDGTNG